jgi:TRAP-type C4-dicarboxylate transport system permease small subunit
MASSNDGAISVLLSPVLSSLNALGSFWIFVLMILINMDAFGRTLFAAPIDGVNEVVELSLVGIVFLQLGDSTRHGRLTRSDGFLNIMLKRRPRIGHYMASTFDFLGMVFMGIIIWGSYPMLIESIEGDYFVGNEGVFTAPVWPVNLVIVIGCAVTLLQFAVFIGRHARFLRTPNQNQIG